jgi:diguanylate cyclase (GGDEF)-like protein
VREWFGRQTLRGKVQIVIMATTSIVLLILFFLQTTLQYIDLRQSVLDEIGFLVEGVSEKSAVSLAAGDKAAASLALAGLRSKSKILAGQIYDREGKPFAGYGGTINPRFDEHIKLIKTPNYYHQFYLDHVCMHLPLMYKGAWQGSLVIQSSLVDMSESMARFTSIWGLTLLLAWLVSFLLSRKFRDVISDPIEKLAKAMKSVSEKKTYSLRINKTGSDELGQLADGFNEMLEQIELRDSELIMNRDRLDHMAHHDSLTGLPNRLLFSDRLKQAIQRAERSKRPLAVIFIDLDRFKNINDTLGHDVGDLVLLEAAHRLEHSLRKSDTIARLGGDEFVVILEEFESQESVAQIARKIIQELSHECQIMQHRLYVTASLGISFYPDNGTDLGTLKRCADIAMFRAKEMGRNNYQFYMPGMGARAREMLAMENDLREVVGKGQLALFFQPQVSMRNGSVCGVEALLRWNHPTKGLILPAEFIPLAEETGVILQLGEWVLGETCRKARAWLDDGLGPVCFAVNVSPRQFRQTGLVEIVRTVLEDTHLPAHLLELELTETLLMTDVEDAIEKMTKLKELGVRLAIDDFGSGYSSLSYLKHFPINKLKIDRGFIKELNEDRYDLAIAASVASLAKIMGLDAVAEGVETREQEGALLGLGMEWAQGFLYERPMPSDQFEIFLGRAQMYDNARLDNPRPGQDP